MIVASNIYDDIAMAAAFGAVNAIRHSTELNPFDLCRADLLYFASVGDRANVLLSAELLVDEARIVRDVSLACKGFRNAAEAFASFGFVDRAQSLLLESRTLAARLAYETSVVSADLRLASLAIFAMDTTGATRYLASAEQSISLHRPSIPLLRADFYLFSCWLALLLGDETAAAKASHGMTRTLRKQNLGTAHAAVTGTRLATHRGKATAELMRGFDTLCNGLLTRTHDCNKEFSLAAVVLFALRHDRRESVQELAHSVLAALVRHGRRPWPYVTELLRR